MQQTVRDGGRCPELYRQPFYIFIRFLFAFGIAGPLPYLLDVTHTLAALYMGASAPIIIDKMAKGIQPVNGGGAG